MAIRIGNGYDSHRFEEGKPLMLGGIHIPHHAGLKGHSDGDALLHAITDALFGAVSDGDIGSHFPDTDPRWEGADSSRLLAMAGDRVHELGYSIVNIDASVLAQEPKLRPHVDVMRARIAEVLSIPVDSVSVKGKTNEGMDAVGRHEGIVVFASVLVQSN